MRIHVYLNWQQKKVLSMCCNDVRSFRRHVCKCIDILYCMFTCQLFRVFVLGRIFLDFNISACYFIVFM